MADATGDRGTITDGWPDSQSTQPPTRKHINWWLLLLSSAAVAVGTMGGPLLQRLYYVNGGNRKWLSSWLQSVGFPILIPLLIFLYLKEAFQTTSASGVFFMELKLFLASCAFGLILGLNEYMYSAGLSYLPVSTFSLLFSTQLAFTALFAFFIVKQKFTLYSFNSVVVMTLGAAVLALPSSSDQPPSVTKGKYLLGIFLTLGGAALVGLSLPLVEFCYRFSCRPITYTVVMQFQIVMKLIATLFISVAMLINNDFEVWQSSTTYTLNCFVASRYKDFNDFLELRRSSNLPIETSLHLIIGNFKKLAVEITLRVCLIASPGRMILTGKILVFSRS